MQLTMWRLPAALVAVVAAAVAAAPAHALQNVVHTSGNTFVPERVVIDRGGSLTHTNADLAAHNVVATDNGPDGEPLFSSGAPKGIGAWEVEGEESLEPGSYGFLCTIHPWMKGALEVVDASAPIPEAPEPPPGVSALPTGFVPTPTSLTVFSDALYVASYAEGTVSRFPLLEAGLLGPRETYASGFSSPLGVAFAPGGTMFVSDSHASERPGRSVDGRVWAVDPADGSRSVVIDELPNGRHNTNGLAVHGDRLYIANGNSTDDGVSGGPPEEPLSGTLLSVPLDARGLTASSAEVVVEARGMRNLYDVAFRPGTSEAWIPTNGPDFFDPYGEDLLEKVDVAGADADFGFPGCIYAAPPAEPRFKQNPAVADTHPCDPAHTPPEQLLGLHVSANGLAFGPDDGLWDGDLFIAEFGNFFGDRPRGHQVVRVPIDEQGRSGPPRTFLPGVAPLDLAFGPPGSGMYVADFATGQILLVRDAA